MSVPMSQGSKAGSTELALAVGETLQVQFMDDDTESRHNVTVIGYLPERSILVTAPEKGGRAMPVEAGRAVMARQYSGDEAKGFTCTVLRASSQPYAYLHLSYPTKVEPMLERAASRVRSAIAVRVRVEGAGGVHEIPAVIRDVSNTGAQVLAGASAGRPGDRIVIMARLPLDTIGDQAIDLPAVIRNVQEETRVKGSLWHYRCGVEFEPLDPQSTLILRAYLYERFARR
jgi:hypothetical protein